jgi:hypothetical protein
VKPDPPESESRHEIVNLLDPLCSRIPAGVYTGLRDALPDMFTTEDR